MKIAARLHRSEFTLDVAVDVPAAGTVALFGRSGCGKTTLANIIAGLLQPESAVIEIGGVTLENTQTRTRVPVERRRIGYVFQDARLFPHFSVLGNLRYGERRAPAAQRAITFDHVVDLLGLTHLLQRRPRELSGGERQRVALGRALLSQPRLLLLDEPLASLDAARREEVLPYLEKLRDELSIPIIFVSHQFDEVLRLATHVVLMNDGRIVAQGAVEAMSLHPELRAIVGAEAVGSVVSGSIVAADPHTGLAAVQVGEGVLNVTLRDAHPGTQVRVQVLARDVILATYRPEGLSVRNILAGRITAIVPDDVDADLVSVDVGGSIVLSRVTRAALQSLSLQVGMQVWVLVKAVSIRGHAFLAPRGG
ncbi:MAG TPA: molybdenum ABC transporter ATP-binding protein [Povalibacter sp.]|uniref:molybdenum ABC transporter ATP-binding protein n=1 Tax=Povalibacter sp. TaxID=1962978 RepID=UPI002B51A3F5|nr:molybdenum ABC transporter ATP-binding protein [Povalibacter sp.]HMN45071.1 molybdenum ABC transporter ATP-binding protein [Povalibacter sp.]